MSPLSIYIRFYKGIARLEPYGDLDADGMTLLNEAFWVARQQGVTALMLELSHLHAATPEVAQQIGVLVAALHKEGIGFTLGPTINGTRKLLAEPLLANSQLPALPPLDGNGMLGMVVANKLDNLRYVRAFMEESFAHLAIDRTHYYPVLMAADELCANVIRHSYEGHREDGDPVTVLLKHEDGVVDISVIDQGARFDPTAFHSLPLQDSILQGKAGGMGLPLVHRLTDTFDFSRQEEHNISHITKRVA